MATFGTDDAHHATLWAWASDFGPITQAGVEGTGSFGYRLAQFLTGAGVPVFEVNRPNRVIRRRRGKSDSVDAEAAARAVLAGDATATLTSRTGPAGQLRALLVARRSARKARTQTEQQLRSLILELDDDNRTHLDRRRIIDLTAACAALTGTDGTSLALRARPGIGPVCAAQLLVTAGDNPDRLHSEAPSTRSPGGRMRPSKARRSPSLLHSLISMAMRHRPPATTMAYFCCSAR